MQYSTMRYTYLLPSKCVLTTLPQVKRLATVPQVSKCNLPSLTVNFTRLRNKIDLHHTLLKLPLHDKAARAARSKVRLNRLTTPNTIDRSIYRSRLVQEPAIDAVAPIVGKEVA